MALVSRGWTYGHNLFHLAFPLADHNEKAWGMRLHLPLQFMNGAVARASRVDAPVLSGHPSEREHEQVESKTEESKAVNDQSPGRKKLSPRGKRQDRRRQL